MSKKSSSKSRKVDREIEIQVQVEKIAPLIKLLKSQGKLIGISHQIDDYYTPAHRTFTDKRPVSEWLRIRCEGKRHSITYKNWYTDIKGRNNWCDEYQTDLSDSEALKKIFKAVDFRLIARVDKKRTSYLLKDYEVSIDKIKSLGTFIEIEYKGNSSANPQELIDRIIKFIQGVGVGKIVRNFVSYPYMLLFPTEIKYEQL